MLNIKVKPTKLMIRCTQIHKVRDLQCSLLDPH